MVRLAALAHVCGRRNRATGAHKGAITRLIADRDVRVAGMDDITLTPKGQKRVMEKIIPKVGSQ